MRGQQNGSKHTHCGWRMVNGSMKRQLVIRRWYVLFKIWQSLYTVASKTRNCINTIWQYYMNILSITPWYRGAALSDCPEIWQPLNTSAKQSYVACVQQWQQQHYTDVIMGAMASQITSLTIVYSPVYSGADQRKHQSPTSLAFVRGIHRWPTGEFPHKWPVTRKMFPFDDVIMA